MTFAQTLESNKRSLVRDNGDLDDGDEALYEAIPIDEVEDLVRDYLQKADRENRLSEAIYELSNLEVEVKPKP